MALALPALAGAQTYPEPKEPGKVAPKPKGPFHTYTVCRARLRLPQDPGRGRQGEGRRQGQDQVRHVPRGGEGHRPQEGLPADRRQPEEPAQGRSRRPRKGPERHLRQRRRRGDDRRRDGPQLQGQRLLRHQRRSATRSTTSWPRRPAPTASTRSTPRAATMENSEAYYVNDGSFYIGQTPQQDKPIRSIVRNVDGWGSPIGFSGTNMRYVTITKSRFYNNAAGIVPNSADGGEVRAGRGQRHHRQRHLLEQLQLLGGRAVQDPARRPGGAGAGGHRHRARRRPPQPRREQPDLRQLPRRRGDDRGHPELEDPRGAGARRQLDHRQRVRAQRRPTPTAATSPTTATAAATASRATPAWR